MRAFLAIGLPPPIRTALETLQQDLAHSGADVKWVEPAHLHVTLKFLGEIADEQRQAIEVLLKRVADRHRSFALGLGSVGAFPSVTAPRVIWVGLTVGHEHVSQLATAIDEAGAAFAVEKDVRPFSPHLTIGRVRSSRRRQELVRQLQRTAWEPPPPWQVGSLTFYQSILSSAGPSYTVLADLPLAG